MIRILKCDMKNEILHKLNNIKDINGLITRSNDKTRPIQILTNSEYNLNKILEIIPLRVTFKDVFHHREKQRYDYQIAEWCIKNNYFPLFSFSLFNQDAHLNFTSHDKYNEFITYFKLKGIIENNDILEIDSE